jgi:starvation-inducible outer membrane lipoprotein
MIEFCTCGSIGVVALQSRYIVIMNIKKYFILVFVVFMLSGCFLTKVVTVPARVGGAILSTIPVVGDTADEVIDSAADAVDKIPL